MISAMTATAADYVWFEQRFPDLAEAHCFTLVHKLPPAEIR
jgi:isocitrate lyase